MNHIIKRVDIWAKNAKISSKMIFLITFIIIPVLVLNILYYNGFQSIFEANIEQSYENILTQYKGSLTGKFNIYSAIAKSIAANGTIQEILFEDYSGISMKEHLKTSRRFANEIRYLLLAGDSDELSNITVFACNSSIMTDGSYLAHIDDISDAPWFQQAKTKECKVFYTSITNNRPAISIFHPIFSILPDNFGQFAGIIKIDLIIPVLFGLNEVQMKDFSSGFFITDSKGEIIYRGANDYFNQNTKDSRYKIFSVPFEGINSFDTYAEGAAPEGEWLLNMAVDNTALRRKLLTLNQFVAGTFIVLIIITCLFAYAFNSLFARRITYLFTKIKKIKEGVFKPYTALEGNDELAMIDASLNDMVEQLDCLIKQNYIKEIERKTAEFKSLQYQINPHFLYNTLEAVNEIAAVYKAVEIRKITQCLGEMFRYNLHSEGELVSFDNELKHIKNYIEIELIRCEGRFLVEYDIDERSYSAQIPRFIMQPVIENSIRHGIIPARGKCTLSISAKIEDDNFIIKMQDDGIGIDEETLSKLLLHINSENTFAENQSTAGIGIKNVNSRLKLMYGEQYGVAISGAKNNGVSVTIKVPYETGGLYNV